MTDQELGQLVKSKYPQYESVDDAELGAAVKQKYPQYAKAEVSPAPSSLKTPETPMRSATQASSPLQSVYGGLQKVGEGMGEFGKGMVKGVAHTAFGALDLTEKAINPALTAIGKKPVSTTFGASRFTPTNAMQKAGFGAEQTAELATPIPGLSAVKGTKLLPSMIRGATEMGLKSAIQSGGSPMATAMGAAGGAVMAPAEKALEFGGKATMEILGKSTGAGEASLKAAYNSPSVMKFARQAGKEGVENLQNQALSEAKAGLQAIEQARGKSYRTALEKVKASKEEIDAVTTAARDRAKQLLEEHGVGLVEGKKLNNLDFSNSVIEKGQKSVEKAFNDVTRWTDNTPAGLDTLKKRLASHLNEVKDAPGAYQFIKDLRDTVRSGLDQNVPGYKEMTSGYRKASELISDLERTMSLGDKASKETSMRKLLLAMRQDVGLRRDMLMVLGAAGGKDVLAKVAGTQLTPLSARGLAGVAEGIGGGATAALGLSGHLTPAQIPALLLTFAAASPRLVGESVSLLGKAERAGITPALKKSLQALAIKASQAIASNPQEAQTSPQQ